MPDMLRPMGDCFAVMPTVMHKDRIVPAPPGFEFEPRINADPDIRIAIVVTEIVMIISRIAEEAEMEIAGIDDDAKRICLPLVMSREINRCV